MEEWSGGGGGGGGGDTAIGQWSIASKTQLRSLLLTSTSTTTLI